MEAPTRVTRVVTRDGAELRLIRVCDVAVDPSGPLAERRRIEQPVFRVGSHPSNDLCVGDETVSRHHLEIRVVPEGYRLIDLSSSNGTWMGAMRLRDVTVSEPVALSVGGVRLLVTPRSDEAEVPASGRERFGHLLGRSVAMRELFDQLDRVAASDCTVLLEGETGVGKSEVAESLHVESQRARGPFVVIDCASLSASLLESELFGHRRGAFTGATGDRDGLLVEADGGTVFLDEIGELPIALQAKLLGALERRRVTPLGADAPVRFDVRVIAASHEDLARAVNEGRFRADLFYRVAVARIQIPPLRDRLADIPLLVRHFLDDLREQGTIAAPLELSSLTMASLAAQRWPGNVRELRNAVERAALGLLGDGGGAVAGAGEAAAAATGREPLAEARERHLADFERRYLLEVLDESGQNVSAAARLAGVERRNFQRLLRRHGVSARKGRT